MRSIYSPDGYSITFLNAQLTVGQARVEYAPWTDSPSASILLVPPVAPLHPVSPVDLWDVVDGPGRDTAD